MTTPVRKPLTLTAADCPAKPTYPNNGGTTASINFTAPDFPEGYPWINFTDRVDGGNNTFPIRAVMDAGSTGVVVSAATLGLCERYSNATLKPPNGAEYLSSSGRLWDTLNFSSNDAGIVETRVPVLAITRSSICKRGWINGECVDQVSITNCPPELKYLGVGFGRWSQEQPKACPDKVPFTNLVPINGMDYP
jgi:hypothetical protein